MRVPGVFGTSFEPAGEPLGTAVLVPGRGYPPQAPLLFFAGVVLLQHGWRVEHHWWDPPRHRSDGQTSAWVREQVEGALPLAGRTVIVGKSLGTWAAPLAAERGLPGVWLTPLLEITAVTEAIAANPAPQLLVGGTADDLWDSAVAAQLAGPRCEVLEIDGGDHVLMAGGDAVRGVEMHVEVVRGLDTWLGGIGSVD
jgi:predicted alpha/beta-hydrolase family hydrolase